MELNTLQDVHNAFPNDESARKWLANIRWGEWAICPYCGNEKAYFIENGTRYKCANKTCYKKFSVTIKTVFEASNIKIDKWILLLFIYAKKRGKPSSLDLEQSATISPKTAFLVFDRLDYIWKFVSSQVKPTSEIIQEMVVISINQYERYIDFKHSDFYKNPYHIAEITDINDKIQYNALVRYIRYYINNYAKWILNKSFASPEEVMSELFLYMRDAEIKEYNAETILKHIWHTINVLYDKYIKDHPNLDRTRRAKIKLWKQDARINLKNTYIIETIKATKAGKKLSTREIKSNHNMMADKKEKLLSKRKNRGGNFDFHSHFS